MDKNKENVQISLIEKLISNTPMIFYIIDKDWIFKLSEGLGLSMIGLEPGQVVGMSVRDIYAGDDEMLSALESAFSGSLTTMNSQVGHIYFESYLIPYYQPNGEVEGVIGVAVDISQRVEARKELDRTNKLQEALISSVSGMLYMYNSKQELTLWNDWHTKLTGYEESELAGFSLRSWFDDENWKKALVSIAELEEQGHSSIEVDILKKDGANAPMYLSSVATEIDGEAYMVGMGVDISARLKAEQDLLELNQTLEHKVKERTLELSQTNEELMDVNQELSAMNEEMQAINEQLNDNNLIMQEMQSHLVESEKMAALGTLVAGVAHEVNTPIGVSVTAASHLADISKDIMKQLEQGDVDGEDLKFFMEDLVNASSIIERNLDRASNLVQSFKQLSVDQSVEASRVFEVCKYIEETIVSLRPKYKDRHIETVIEFEDEVIMNGWPGALAQIITNLYFNAIQHGFTEQDSGRINVEIISDSNNARIMFKDNGKGMDRESVAKIFEPFYTTRRQEGGTGLGMSVVYTLVTQKFGGKIRCKSKLGGGTVFEIMLPLRGTDNEN